MLSLKRGSFLLSGLFAAALQASPAVAQEKTLAVFTGPSLAKTVEALATEFNGKKVAEAEVVSNETQRVIKAFCEGQTEEQKVLIISRKLSLSEMQRCEKDGASLMGIQLVRYILGLASNSPSLAFDANPKTIYLGIVDEVPRSAIAGSNLPARKRLELLNATSDSFITNPFRTWRDIDASLPDIEINFVAPDGGSPKVILDARLLEAGCRGFAEIKKIFVPENRIRTCTLYRQDGHVTFTEGATFLEATKDLLAAKKPTIGFVRHADLRLGGVTPLTLKGVDPLDPNFNPKTFATRQGTSVYFFVQTVYGKGPSKEASPSASFLTALLSEPVIGPEGAFVKAGFYAQNQKERQDVRAVLRSVRGLGAMGVN